MRSVIFTIFTLSILSVPFFGWATDPPTENKDNNGVIKQVESSEITKTEALDEKPTSIKRESESRPTITHSTKEIKGNSADNAPLSEFNYLFYFIYKHKYQDKEISDLEKKM